MLHAYIRRDNEDFSASSGGFENSICNKYATVYLVFDKTPFGGSDWKLCEKGAYNLHFDGWTPELSLRHQTTAILDFRFVSAATYFVVS